MPGFSSVLIGNESLVIQCGEMLLEADNPIRAVVTRNAEVQDWAKSRGLPVLAPGADLAARLKPHDFDWLLSIANLDLIPQDALDMAARGAVNFHDGPLPRYAGLNAPVWALINGEKTHGISWHLISGGVDEGDIIAQSRFDIAPDETALTLNTKCYSAAIDSFGQVMAELASDTPAATPQDLDQRSYFGRDARPEAGGRLDFTKSAETLAGLVRALDHGDYRNPLLCPKIEAGGEIRLVHSAVPAPTASGKAPGTVTAATADSLTVATGTNDIVLSRISDCFGRPVPASDVAQTGDVLPSPDTEDAARIDAVLAPLLRAEPFWRDRLEQVAPLDLPRLGSNGDGDAPRHGFALPEGAGAEDAWAALAILLARMAGTDGLDMACHLPDAPDYVCPWVPVHGALESSFAASRDALSAQLAQALDNGGFACDLPARLAEKAVLPTIGLSRDAGAGCLPGTALTLAVQGAKATLISTNTGPDAAELERLAARLTHLLEAAVQAPDTAPGALPILPDAERRMLLEDWNDTARDFPADTCIHEFFEQQVARNPEAEALAFEGESLSYDALNARANRIAHVLQDMGVRPGVVVGLHLPRSTDLLVAALAILKAGGAYLPMDPAYPADRTALYAEDSGARVIVTNTGLAHALPETGAQLLSLDDAPQIASAPAINPQSGVTGEDLAYLIYTSGSTGKPKGVMVEHRNVANFFTGMDERIAHDPPGVWLALTSLSFDISVLELFWTLARGFKVVLSSDENRALVAGDNAGVHAITGRGMEFSLFYWGNDDGQGRDKYKMLLDGARFADQNGFCAVWTPERHFHAFGGPYPNPSVTGAAVAAITRNIAVRAGSCVAPLHHPARIAEDWAVIDNLTNGRAGLGIASGWQPHDFVLRPENTPPENKPAMYRAIDDLRRLWRGEEVEFPTADGTPHAVLTQPRPVSKELPIWITTAGNPDTWREAGEIGANVLTHLLGQSIDEVGEKIRIYHAALREAGHDPDDFTVTLMLHTFVGTDREAVREIARGPMKDYLRSAAGLIKQFAWVFPAFKKPKGVNNAFDIDLGILSEEELDAILEFAFLRYFEDSGLFGTVDDCLARTEQLKRIGVDEIACLIDYGIARDTVLEGLKPLAEVVRRTNQETGPAEDDFSIAAQIQRHAVTHMQCTPSMAQMLVMNDEARHALSHVRHLMIGGEALPGGLVRELLGLAGGHVENMYGPTETTIWSTTGPVVPTDTVAPIGRPIANTRVYVLDENRAPVPLGMAGELYIGGAGVARGYWQRPDLTDERFVDDPFTDSQGARLYRTGDLVRWRADGQLDFLGRADDQVKLHGYRIELGEIESALDTHPGVRQSVVMLREDVPGLRQLVAYTLAETPVPEADLKAHLGARLPAHMLPARFVTLDAFPLTPNKKVDRNALPAPMAAAAAGKPSSATEDTAPVGTVMQQVADIWSRILGVSGIGAKDNFFDLGGHSLLAVQAHREIRKELGADRLSITDIFRFPTLDGLARTVEDKLSGGAKPAKTPETDTVSGEKAEARAEAMKRRREMRARRQSSSA